MIKVYFKKAVIGLIILIILGALFQQRVRIKDVILGFDNPDLPKPITYAEIKDALDRAGSADNQTQEDIPKPTAEEINAVIRQVQDRAQETEQETTTEVSSEFVGQGIPSEYNLAIPFSPQAPHANWELPYQEACEETSLIMVDRYFKNQTLSADEADKDIHKLVLWQKQRFGYYEDTKAREVVVIGREYFDFNVELDYDVTAENIKKHISDNKIVIVPAAGQMLGNPYFTGLGPVYHMLVIRGYTEDKFITNDPGTKRGKEFLYDYNTLINAIHDWPLNTGGDSQSITAEVMATGEKVLIVVSVK
ncbi:hypothetical protein CL632_02535 [bacterium]|jgi:hypothetical protein|nr:hypothetical protein [bacterium]MDP6571232.1 C39 family peptidase [Patescibacteria group bacterium]MDP6756219.1 C39 family peptidase [Patescibacteria group bacterium]|tara:strand:+ start:19863 stop:20780 length:918 start_codon:yes stop_codon:yes gene_type:complete